MLKLFSTGEIAQQLDCCRETINNWVKKGKIEPFAVAQNRQFFTIEQLNKIKALNSKLKVA